MQPIDEIAALEPHAFDEAVRPAFQPVVIRGAAAHWPIVEAAKQSAAAALDLIDGMDSGAMAEIMIAPASENGRFFYSRDMRGFNFKRERAALRQVTTQLRQLASHSTPLAVYAGAASTDTHLPAFASAHPFPLAGMCSDTAGRIWLGNATQVATHFDLSDNFAIVAAGSRRFTLFPPEATGHLYVGPLNQTLAGQPVSMVDPLNPDVSPFPNYAKAEALAVTAVLHPGDLIYIPTLWWHHVQAIDPINILVNYWHNDVADGGGFIALVHAMLAIRDRPQPERAAWRQWFDHFVFGDDAAHAADHLPVQARGVNGAASPERDRAIREYVARMLVRGP